MARIDTEAWEATNRQRLNDQVGLVGRGNSLGVTVRSTRGDEDLTILTVPNMVIVEGRGRDKKLETLTSFVDDPRGPFVSGGRPSDERVTTVTSGVSLFELPKLKGKRRGEVDAADVVFDALPGVGRPEYYIHVSGDHGRPCPATEPEETGLVDPWPGVDLASNAGQGVKVTIVDTGWWPTAARHPWLAQGVGGDEEVIGANLHAYSGHGTFIAGIVRCRAPQAEIRHERFRVQPRQPGQRYVDYHASVRETAIIRQLQQALRRHAGDPRPHVINLSAGTYTLDDAELTTLTAVGIAIQKLPNTVLVAAAGNDSTDVPFYPAASGWAVGVGSLDRQGGVSNFSNFGVNADVYALGRNHVNAYPDGRYRCRETPDKEDRRVFKSGLARWSGTSFSAPLVVGLIAAELSANPGTTAKAAKDSVLGSVQPKQVRVYGQAPSYPYGQIKRLRPKFPQ
jgi:subtilisin family serine protease